MPKLFAGETAINVIGTSVYQKVENDSRSSAAATKAGGRGAGAYMLC